MANWVDPFTTEKFDGGVTSMKKPRSQSCDSDVSYNIIYDMFL